MGTWDNVINGITGAVDWLGKNKEAANLLGSVIVAGGGYLAQKEASKNAIKQQRELMEYQDRLKEKYSAVPKSVDTSYNLAFSDSANLAGDGILASLQKREKGGV